MYARVLARIARQCVSMLRAVDPGKLMLSNVYRLLRTKISWSDIVLVDTGSKQDLLWWQNSLEGWNSKVIKKKNPGRSSDIITDASTSGYGAIIYVESTKSRASGQHYYFVANMQ